MQGKVQPTGGGVGVGVGVGTGVGDGSGRPTINCGRLLLVSRELKVPYAVLSDVDFKAKLTMLRPAAFQS